MTLHIAESLIEREDRLGAGFTPGTGGAVTEVKVWV